MSQHNSPVLDKEAAMRILEERNNPTPKPARPQKPKSFDAFLKLHNARKKDDHQRLGQRFCFMYVKGKWPELFYAPFPEARDLICQWLVENNHADALPEVDLAKRVHDLRSRFGKS